MYTIYVHTNVSIIHRNDYNDIEMKESNVRGNSNKWLIYLSSRSGDLNRIGSLLVNNSSAIVMFFFLWNIFPASKYIDQHNVILKSIWQKQRDFMACASVQCKITNRIDLNLICLCLSVSIQHVQATRLIYSVSNVFAKTNLKEIFSLLCVKYNSNLLIELKNII